MRTRLAAMFALVLVLSAALPAALAPVHAATRVMAQDDTGSDGDPTGAGDDVTGEEGNPAGEGQSDPDAESGAGGDEEADASAPAGPPWTYQMARMALGLLVLMGIGMALAYRKLVMQRQRTGV